MYSLEIIHIKQKQSWYSCCKIWYRLLPENAAPLQSNEGKASEDSKDGYRDSKSEQQFRDDQFYATIRKIPLRDSQMSCRTPGINVY